MDLQLKERVVIELLEKEDCAVKEIHNRFKNVYGDIVIESAVCGVG